MSAFLQSHLPTLTKWSRACASLPAAAGRGDEFLEARIPRLWKVTRRLLFVLGALAVWGLLGGLVMAFEESATDGPGPLGTVFLTTTLILLWLTPIVLTIYAVARFASHGPGLASVAFRILLGCSAVLGCIAFGGSVNVQVDMGVGYLLMFVAMVLGPLAAFGALLSLILWPIGLWQAFQRRRRTSA